MIEVDINGVNIFGQKYEIHILAHEEDEKGRIFTLRKRTKIWFEKETFMIPRNYRCDGASVPRFLWPILFPRQDFKAIRAAIAHDYIYEVQLEGWTRAKADMMFYQLLVRDGMNATKAKIAYLGVRIFGWLFWRRGK